MPFSDPAPDQSVANQFASLAGKRVWRKRLAELAERAQGQSMTARAVQQRHAIELAIARFAEGGRGGLAERRIAAFAEEAVALARRLAAPARARLQERIAEGLSGEGTLVPLFHLLRTAAMQRARGYEVRFDGITDAAPYDLLIRRDGAEAEIACETVSAEDGRALHRGEWFRLVDRVNPELHAWLAAHPGRYILKMTLAEEACDLATIEQRITDLLASQKRQEQSPEVMLKLDPLMLAGAQAGERALPARLRALFGHEAHLAVTTAQEGGSVFVMAARSGRENSIPAAVTRRIGAAAPARLTGERAGVMAVFLEDVERAEWRELREKLELEGATRRFLTEPAARPLVAVTCASRMELYGAPEREGEGGGAALPQPGASGGETARADGSDRFVRVTARRELTRRKDGAGTPCFRPRCTLC
jgi:hypothetical protein